MFVSVCITEFFDIDADEPRTIMSPAVVVSHFSNWINRQLVHSSTGWSPASTTFLRLQHNSVYFSFILSFDSTFYASIEVKRQYHSKRKPLCDGIENCGQQQQQQQQQQ